CAFDLWLVQRAPFVQLDVLGFGTHHAGHDWLCLLRDSRRSSKKRYRATAELRGISLWKRRAGDVVCGARSRAAARLVALPFVHRTFVRRCCFSCMRGGSAATRTDPAGRSAIPAPVEYVSSRDSADVFSLLAACDDRSYPTVAGDSRFRSLPDWSRVILDCR